MRSPHFLLLVAALSVSCSGGATTPTSERETIEPGLFARVFGDLVIARIEALPDTMAYQRNRRSILERYGVTSEDMRTFVEVHGDSDDLMARIYGVVDARLDTLFGERPGRTEPLTSPGLDFRDAIAEEEKASPDR